MFQDGLLVYGMAGTCKTTKLKQIKGILQSNEHTTICPIHKACKLVNGTRYIECFVLALLI